MFGGSEGAGAARQGARTLGGEPEVSQVTRGLEWRLAFAPCTEKLVNCLARAGNLAHVFTDIRGCCVNTGLWRGRVEVGTRCEARVAVQVTVRVEATEAQTTCEPHSVPGTGDAQRKWKDPFLGGPRVEQSQRQETEGRGCGQVMPGGWEWLLPDAVLSPGNQEGEHSFTNIRLMGPASQWAVLPLLEMAGSVTEFRAGTNGTVCGVQKLSPLPPSALSQEKLSRKGLT